MTILENVKAVAERLTGSAYPSADQVLDLVRQREPETCRFDDDGLVPNHPSWPLILYRGVIDLPARMDPAAVLEALFERNGWGRSWRNGIYGYVHYHPRVHEVLGIASGQVKVQFGGERGRAFLLGPGDVAILPAGTGHQRLEASDDLLVVGAYPPSGSYDECRTQADHAKAVEAIPSVERPQTDPVYGGTGPLVTAWQP